MSPKFASVISRTVGQFIMAFSGLMYVNRLVTEPTQNVANVAFSAIAVIGGLSGLCFALVSCLKVEEQQKAPLYAGEKFLHACLLFVQSIFIKFTAEEVLKLSWMQSQSWIPVVVDVVTYVLLLGTALYGTYSSIFAFQSLNDFLWSRYVERVKKQRT